MNVVIDFNQNGVWGDLVSCPSGQIPEHVLQNFIIPNGFAGPLSILLPPGFMIGPNSGYVWARFSISEQAVAQNWDGHGFFEDGESEDYLLYIAPVQQSDFGDAPENVLAYPSNGVMGSFPTCITAGALGHVEHLHHGADLGPAVDYEMDGNAGLCPTFSPYDDDECFADGDAGLIIPEPYTIVGSSVVLCPNSNGTSLGYPCDTAVWGINVDIDVNNFMPSQMDAYMNVLIDWNRNGIWGDSLNCSGVLVEEHVLQNFIIPTNYSGALSGLMPPDFLIGPGHGFVWCRFTISDVPVYVPWAGNGLFEDGETEDYLLHVDTINIIEEYEYGDAPEGVIAYPSTAMMGFFPTCTGTGPANHFVSHLMEEAIYWGPTKDAETDGNAGLCSPYSMPYNNDECFTDNDAGLILPSPYTIQLIGGVLTVVPCTGAGGRLDTICNMVFWGSELDIKVTNNDTIEAVANVLMDFNQNGRWDLDTSMHCGGSTIYEHVLRNFPIPSGYSGPISGLFPMDFLAGPNVGYIWTRFTVSEKDVPLYWDGVGDFERGETEDYLLYLDMNTRMGELIPFDLLRNLNIFPNPSKNTVSITYELLTSVKMNIEVYDIRGCMLKMLMDAEQPEGMHTLNWDGSMASGQSVDAGIYIVKISLNNIPIARERLMMMK